MVPTLEELCADVLAKQVLEHRRETPQDDFPPWYHEIYPWYQELINRQLTLLEITLLLRKCSNYNIVRHIRYCKTGIY